MSNEVTRNLPRASEASANIVALVDTFMQIRNIVLNSSPIILQSKAALEAATEEVGHHGLKPETLKVLYDVLCDIEKARQNIVENSTPAIIMDARRKLLGGKVV